MANRTVIVSLGRRWVPVLGILPVVAVLLGAGPVRSRSTVDATIRSRLQTYGVRPVDPGVAAAPEKVALGRFLFFDKILSGNRDVACATCHHPRFVTGDARSLGVGTLGIGLGPDRIKDPTRAFIPRNATELFNRGSREWHTMFWDGRVESSLGGRLSTPAKQQLPGGLDGVLAAQAMFPVTSRDEMRGDAGDPGNELSPLADSDFRGIWRALMNRLWSIPAYRDLFRAAYPGVPDDQFGFQHAANAIAAFETAAYTFTDSPWDRYVAGDTQALDPASKRGALLFYGTARCADCHRGSLLTDQRFHVLCVPQFGPGKPPGMPKDFGRFDVTSKPSDRYAFRTPPLRNVMITGPWMHDGAYVTLEGAIRQHLEVVASVRNYDLSQLPMELQVTMQDDPAELRDMLAMLDPLLRRTPRLTRQELSDLMAFLASLTSPSVPQILDEVPPIVPSGLPVDQ